MASELSTEAIQFLQKDEQLQREILPYLDIKMSGLAAAIRRNSKILTTYHAVMALGEKMGIAPTKVVVVK